MNNNRLIAEFMGFRTNSFGDYNIDKDVMGFDMIVCSLADTKFHTSWDWLMPVLKKINLKLNPDTYGAWRMINRPTEYNIEEVYAQAVRFIKQHNDER